MPPSVAGFTLAQLLRLAMKKTHFEQCKMQFSAMLHLAFICWTNRQRLLFSQLLSFWHTSCCRGMACWT